MSRRKDYDFNNYAKYRERKKATSSNMKSITRLWRLASISNSQSEAKRKQRRRELDRKLKENERKQQQYENEHGPITAKDILITLILGIIGAIIISMLFEFGLKATIIIILVVIVAALVIGFAIYLKNNPISRLTEEEKAELHRQLENIEVYKNVVNTSTDITAVKSAMDELISIIDFIMEYDEETLNEAGMSKSKLPEQRQFIIDNYDVILQQINKNQ